MKGVVRTIGALNSEETIELEEEENDNDKEPKKNFCDKGGVRT